jgi:hypothetical protein
MLGGSFPTVDHLMRDLESSGSSCWDIKVIDFGIGSIRGRRRSIGRLQKR